MTLDEIDRYGRQMLLPEWGASGQERLMQARVAIAGAGEAARAAQTYLSAAGIKLIVSDPAIEPFSVSITVGESTITAKEDRFAIGAAAAVETIKAILGIPYRALARLEAE